VCVILTLVVVTACARKWTCDLAGQLRERAGADAHDCGKASGDSGAPPAELDAGANGASVPSDGGVAGSPVDLCVASAFAQGKPFYAGYPLTGKDAKLVYGIASDGSGNVTILQYDPGSHQDPTIRATRCVSPEVELSSARNSGSPAPFRCESIEQLGETCGAPPR
jgi:hypothetical protein